MIGCSIQYISLLIHFSSVFLPIFMQDKLFLGPHSALDLMIRTLCRTYALCHSFCYLILCRKTSSLARSTAPSHWQAVTQPRRTALSSSRQRRLAHCPLLRGWERVAPHGPRAVHSADAELDFAAREAATTAVSPVHKTRPLARAQHRAEPLTAHSPLWSA